MSPCERLGVFKKVFLSEICGEIAYIVSTNTAVDKADLLNVGIDIHILLSKSLRIQHSGFCEVNERTSGPILCHRSPQVTTLANFVSLPGRCTRASTTTAREAFAGSISQKGNVVNHFLVDLLIFRLLAVKEKEGINEQWKVCNQ